LSVTPGDYIVSSDCAAERKTINDFMQSIFDGRLFEQISRLKSTYSRPVLLLEGDVKKELENRKNPRAFWGALMKIELDLAIPTIVTSDMLQTAEAIFTLAKRLQSNGTVERYPLRNKPQLLTEKDWQIFVVSGLPGIGEELASRLLDHFGSLRRIFTASTSELSKVKGLGQMKVSRIVKLRDMDYRVVKLIKKSENKMLDAL
jgi:ERCC4-type nuclease